MKIDLSFEWLAGYLRYGHLEGEADFTPEEEKEFKSLLLKEQNNEELTKEEESTLEDYKEYIYDCCHIVIDDYSIEDRGPAMWRDLITN